MNNLSYSFMLFALLVHVCVSMFTLNYYFNMLVNSMDEKFEDPQVKVEIRRRKSKKSR